jgi:16S rRNA (cytosine967-C5)-methyltransferase
MSVVRSQQQVFLRLLRTLQPDLRRDLSLPQRIQHLLARDRAFGSRDRRLYRELIYTTLRYLPWIESHLETDPERAAKVTAWLAAETRDTRNYRAELCADWPALPSSLAERAKFLEADPVALLPGWFGADCPEVFTPTELEAQLARAPLWLRLQTEDAAEVATDFSINGWTAQPSSLLPSAWQVLGEADVTKSSSYTSGRIEIQDLGSQLLLETIGVEPGGRWLDACAGAGGKSLQLSRLLGPSGQVDAHEIRPAALAELKTRADRARITHLRTVGQVSDQNYDGVLVDAPCSGSGTWRRSPHLKWVTTPALIAERAKLQQSLLAHYAAHVRPGGRLVYATCSLSHRENDDIVEGFLASHPAFAPEPFARTFGYPPGKIGLTLLPAQHDTDGFYVASLRRR